MSHNNNLAGDKTTIKALETTSKSSNLKQSSSQSNEGQETLETICQNIICVLLSSIESSYPEVGDSKTCENETSEKCDLETNFQFKTNTHQTQTIINELQNMKNFVNSQEMVSQKTSKMLRLERKRQRKNLKLTQQNEKERFLRQKMRKESAWESLPPELLSSIYCLLSMRDRHSASQVCRHWLKCFYIPLVWADFVLDDLALTKRKFNYYLGYQRMLDPFKTQAYLKRFGSCLRRLTIDPMSNFYNLFEFIKILDNYSKSFRGHFNQNPLSRIREFSFTFGCQFSSSDFTGNEHQSQRSLNQRRSLSLYNLQDEPIGTGGPVLEALKDLLHKLDCLQSLELSNLFLDVHDAQFLLDGVAEKCHLTLQHLTLVNCSRRSYCFIHCGVFVNLTSIALSPQHINEDVLSLLRDLQFLENLYVVQNEFTLRQYAAQSRSTWRSVKRAPKRNGFRVKQIRVHLVYVDNLSCNIRSDNSSEPYSKKPLLIQPVDVTSLIFDSPYTSISFGNIPTLLEHYSNSLVNLEFYQLPKFRQGKHYVDRCDQDLIWLSLKCAKLETLVIREVISTATLILVVFNSSNLQRLIVRENAVRRRYDCGKNNSWSADFNEWLKKTSTSYEATFEYVRSKLGHDWAPIKDEQFKIIRPKHRF